MLKLLVSSNLLLSDLPADVVPNTYKKTKLARSEDEKAKKGEEEEDEKPKATADEKSE